MTNPYVATISTKGRDLIDQLVDAANWPSPGSEQGDLDDDNWEALERLLQHRSVARNRIAQLYDVEPYDDYNGLSGESTTGLQRADGIVIAADHCEGLLFISLVRDDDHFAGSSVPVDRIGQDSQQADAALRSIVEHLVAFAEDAADDDFPNTEV